MQHRADEVNHQYEIHYGKIMTSNLTDLAPSLLDTLPSCDAVHLNPSFLFQPTVYILNLHITRH